MFFLFLRRRKLFPREISSAAHSPGEMRRKLKMFSGVQYQKNIKALISPKELGILSKSKINSVLFPKIQLFWGPRKSPPNIKVMHFC